MTAVVPSLLADACQDRICSAEGAGRSTISSYPGWRELAVDEQGVAGLQAAKYVGGAEEPPNQGSFHRCLSLVVAKVTGSSS
jgi:hypothetical protein